MCFHKVPNLTFVIEQLNQLVQIGTLTVNLFRGQDSCCFSSSLSTLPAFTIMLSVQILLVPGKLSGHSSGVLTQILILEVVLIINHTFFI